MRAHVADVTGTHSRVGQQFIFEREIPLLVIGSSAVARKRRQRRVAPNGTRAGKRICESKAGHRSRRRLESLRNAEIAPRLYSPELLHGASRRLVYRPVLHWRLR